MQVDIEFLPLMFNFVCSVEQRNTRKSLASGVPLEIRTVPACSCSFCFCRRSVSAQGLGYLVCEFAELLSGSGSGPWVSSLERAGRFLLLFFFFLLLLNVCRGLLAVSRKRKNGHANEICVSMFFPTNNQQVFENFEP